MLLPVDNPSHNTALIVILGSYLAARRLREML